MLDTKDSECREAQSVCKSTLLPSQRVSYEYWGLGAGAWGIQAHSFSGVQSLGTEKPTGFSHIFWGWDGVKH